MVVRQYISKSLTALTWTLFGAHKMSQVFGGVFLQKFLLIRRKGSAQFDERREDLRLLLGVLVLGELVNLSIPFNLKWNVEMSREAN